MAKRNKQGEVSRDLSLQEIYKELRRLEKGGDLDASQELARMLGDGLCCQCGRRCESTIDLCWACEMGDFND